MISAKDQMNGKKKRNEKEIHFEIIIWILFCRQILASPFDQTVVLNLTFDFIYQCNTECFLIKIVIHLLQLIQPDMVEIPLQNYPFNMLSSCKKMRFKREFLTYFSKVVNVYTAS